jgi:hypothetical protein
MILASLCPLERRKKAIFELHVDFALRNCVLIHVQDSGTMTKYDQNIILEKSKLSLLALKIMYQIPSFEYIQICNFISSPCSRRRNEPAEP